MDKAMGQSQTSGSSEEDTSRDHLYPRIRHYLQVTIAEAEELRCTVEFNEKKMSDLKGRIEDAYGREKRELQIELLKMREETDLSRTLRMSLLSTYEEIMKNLNKDGSYARWERKLEDRMFLRY